MEYSDSSCNGSDATPLTLPDCLAVPEHEVSYSFKCLQHHLIPPPSNTFSSVVYNNPEACKVLKYGCVLN